MNNTIKQEPVTYTETTESVTITIRGKAFGNLKKIADAMNGASWTENDHTPAWAVRYWIGSFLDRLAYTPETCGSENVTELTYDIIKSTRPGEKSRRGEKTVRMTSKDECLRRYRDGLMKFAVPGNRFYMLTKGGVGGVPFVNWGRAAGLDADSIIADAHDVGVTDRDGSIRSAWETCTMRPDDGTAAATPRPRKKVRTQGAGARAEFTVRTLVGEEDVASMGCSDWLLDLSPVDVRSMTAREQTVAFVRAVIPKERWAYCFAKLVDANGKEYATPGWIGESVRRGAEWVDVFERGEASGFDRIVPNTLSGRQGRAKSGHSSFVSADCLADFQFLILEFDDLPLPWQYAFWRSFITAPHPLSPLLSAIVFSGNKSLHGLLRVGCSTVEQWNDSRKLVAPLFDADADRRTTPPDVLRFCADGQAMAPRQGVRLPGVRRCNKRGEHTGALQRLLFLNAEAG